jgi:hypothetical protein
MTAEQLSFLDLDPEAITRKQARPQARRAAPAQPQVAAESTELVARDVVIEHRIVKVAGQLTAGARGLGDYHRYTFGAPVR